MKSAKSDWPIYADKGKVLAFAGVLGLVALLFALLALRIADGQGIVARLTLGSLSVISIYIAVTFALLGRRPLLVIQDDGFTDFPIRWPLRRQAKARFISWKDIDRILYSFSRGGRSLDIYTKNAPPARTHGYVWLPTLKPAVRIPVMLLRTPEQVMLRELRERAWKHGVVIR